MHHAFSKRKKIAQGGPLLYDELPGDLRVQIADIFLEAIGPPYEESPLAHGGGWWDKIAKDMRAGVPRFRNYQGSSENSCEACRRFLVKHLEDVDEVLDLVEYVCRILEAEGRRDGFQDRMKQRLATKTPGRAIDEVNGRFLEAGVGYRFGSGQVRLVDSEFMNDEVTEKVIPLLMRPGFKKANEDFMQAQKHLRNGDHKVAIGGAGDAVESTMKAICRELGWPFDEGARATDLIKILAREGLFPKEFVDPKALEQLVGFLKAALPDVRNKAGSHGKSPGHPAPPPYLAAFALHEAAAYALMMMRALDALPPAQSG